MGVRQHVCDWPAQNWIYLTLISWPPVMAGRAENQQIPDPSWSIVASLLNRPVTIMVDLPYNLSIYLF